MSHDLPPTSSARDDTPWEALARHLTGESSPDDDAAVRRWLAEDPSRAAVMAALGRTLDRVALEAPAAGVDVEAALARVSARIDAESASTPAVRQRGRVAEERDAVDVHARSHERAARPRRRRGIEQPWAPTPGRERARWRGAAVRLAAALVVLAAGAMFWRGAWDDGAGGVSLIGARTWTTGTGERDSLVLGDGTRVVLAPASELVVPDDYASEARAVRLRGEAWFHVVHDAARPFTVRVGDALVRDLGTAFAVRGDAAGVRVSVTEGSVLLRAEGASDSLGVVLAERDVGVLPAGGRVVAERGGASEADVAFTTGRLIFRDAPIARVREDLRRWYGVELRLADTALADRHLTATFAGEPADRVLEVIALALDVEVERRGDTATLRWRGGERAR